MLIGKLRRRAIILVPTVVMPSILNVLLSELVAKTAWIVRVEENADLAIRPTRQILETHVPVVAVVLAIPGCVDVELNSVGVAH